MNLKLMNLKFNEPEKIDEPKHLIKFDEPEIDEFEKIDEPKHITFCSSVILVHQFYS